MYKDETGRHSHLKEGLRSNKFDNSINCELCDKGFGRFVEQEKHVKAIHDNHEEFRCDQCDNARACSPTI